MLMKNEAGCCDTRLFWCACVVLNHGPPACQAGALPLSYRRMKNIIKAKVF
jgi:hypothetical protein